MQFYIEGYLCNFTLGVIYNFTLGIIYLGFYVGNFVF